MKEQLRRSAQHRINTVKHVLDSPGHKLHQSVDQIRGRWLGSETQANVSHNMGVLNRQLSRMDITIADTTEGYLGMVAGRPPQHNNYPGYGTHGADQSVKPPGMSLNRIHMPVSATIAERHENKSDFTKRTWTVVHESSHGILGTHDYRTYHVNGRNMTPTTYANFPTAHEKDAQHPSGFKKDRTPSHPITWQDAKRDNADSWAGFVMNASQHINARSATQIQSLIRGRQTRQKLQREKSQNAAATKIQALARGHAVRKAREK